MPNYLWDYTRHVLWNYWLWGVLAVVPRSLSLIGWLFPSVKRWLDRNPMMARPWVAVAVLAIGFVIANYAAYHDVRREYDQYKQAMTLAPSPIMKTLAFHELDDFGYWGATSKPERTNITESKRLIGKATQKRETRKLVPALSHKELGTDLFEPTLTIVIPNSVVQDNGPGEKFWHEEPEDDTHTRYYTNDFVDIISGNGFPHSTRWVLPLVFPTTPGVKYQCAYRVQGLDNNRRRVETGSIPFTIQIE